VISLDIPSGVNGDSGEILGTAIRARATVTFGLAKRGQFLYPGAACCGRLYLSRISFPPDLWRRSDPVVALNHWFPLPPRPPDAYKHRMGDVLFIAGAVGYYGAPFFSAYAFLKAGGGFARLAAPRSIIPFLAQQGSEIVFLPQEETASGSLAGKNRENLLALAERADWVVLGPGVSLDSETRQLVRDLCVAVKKPLLIDGDGLTAVAEDRGILEKRQAPTVLTPHTGEMVRLLGQPAGGMAGDRIDVLSRFCRASGVHVVWKGAHSLIGFPDERVYVNLSGNAGMATAGSGDALTGAIAAMAGLGLPLPEAVRKGVFLHGLAGDLAAEAVGEDGLTAGDILRYLPRAVKLDREALPPPYGGRYAGWTVL
jgi:NAD(P)H-hydrate epimerase